MCKFGPFFFGTETNSATLRTEDQAFSTAFTTVFTNVSFGNSNLLRKNDK